MLRFSPKRLYTSFVSHRRSITNQSAEQQQQLDNNRRKLPRQHRRGGLNLSHRYLKLEKSLRGRTASLSKHLDDGYSQNSPLIPAAADAATAVQSNPLSNSPVQLFHGFEIPQEPKPPTDDGTCVYFVLFPPRLFFPLIVLSIECCMSGCAICVYDLHEESLKAYKEALSSLRNSLSALHIPQDEWPSAIRHHHHHQHGSPDSNTKRKEMVMDAFEEMERALKLKRSSLEAETRS